MKETALLFLKLGFLGFGGPLATISMMEDETVKKRGWFTSETFARSYALLKIFPGPTATQMAVQLGRLHIGRWGGLVAGLLFVLPSFFIILALGIFLSGLRETNLKTDFVLGMQISALAVIVQGTWRLASANLKKNHSLLITLISATLVFIQPGLEPLVILFFGILGIGLATSLRVGKFELGSFLLILVCLKAALLTFGTGLAIVPLLEHSVVEKYHWLTHSQFLEALALGQITPGPVVITVTWIGYKILGYTGAAIATVFVFAPGFLNSLFFIPAIEKKWSGTKGLLRFYEFVIPAVVGAMGAVTLRLALNGLKSPVSLSIFFASLVLVFWKKTPPWFVIPFFGFVAMGLSKIF